VRRVTVTAAIVLLGLTVSLTHAQEVEPMLVVGTDAGEVLAGTPARDSMYGRAGDDILLGNAGDDELDGGAGADKLSGGPGRDAASYEGPAVDVALDNLPNDGVPGEGDNVLLDTEDAYGTDGADRIIGNHLENTLDGNGGDDQIVGGSGADGLFGGEGDDRIFSRDGSPDRVECGPGFDTANVDVRDSVVECEVIGRVATTENFGVSVLLGRSSRRASRFKLGNVLTGSRVTFACVRRCRPRLRSTRILYRRVSVRSVGGQRIVRITVRRSRLVAGATFEIGVKARKAKPRCRRFTLAARDGRIEDLIASKRQCTSIARRG
jgi:hemolysin type calcium-binding protein